jgi:cbb3-type cytochrome oxidase maturation protein
VTLLAGYTLHQILFASAALMGLAAWFVYLWAVRTGQFEDVEHTAEAVLRQDDRD